MSLTQTQQDELSAMPTEDAVLMDNFWPQPSKVILRKGMDNWVTGFPSQVETLMAYNPQSGTNKLFAASATSFYDATSTGAVGAAVVTGLNNARWQHINMATSGGSFLMAVNGADKLRGYDGSAWWTDGDGSHDITGVDSATCIGIATFKRRMWLIKKNTASAYYGPTDGIAGAFSQLDFGPIFSRGGQLMTIANWSLDAGIGIDDYAAFVSDQGEVALYKGSDPSSATTWARVGVFHVGPPIGRRCVSALAGDVMLICTDGLVPLSKALMSSRVNTQISLTDKIQNATSAAIGNYGSNFGWQVLPFEGENMVILNVPVSAGSIQYQYVMNTITGAWARFKGWNANCWEMSDGEMYFGGNAVVCKAWQGQNDNGTAITAEVLQAFNYFGNPGMLKEFTLARPLIAIDNSVGFNFGINTDFDRSVPLGVPTLAASTQAKWGVGLWGVGLWGGEPAIQKTWKTVSGIGYAGAIHIVATTTAGRCEWSASTFAFKPAGIL